MITSLKSAPFVVVDDVATRLYMPERMTLDIDILIKANDKNLIYQDLINAQAKRIGDLSIAGSQWQLSDNTALDVLEVEDDWVDAALSKPNYSPDALPVALAGDVMKLSASRTQDLADISRMLGLATEEDLSEVRQVIALYLPTAREDLESLIVLGKLEIGI